MRLGDVVFKVTDKAGKTSYVTKGKIYKPEDAFQKPTNATIFEITEDTDGKVEVGGTFKADPTCPTCAEAAQTALTAALETMKAKHGGKIDPKKNVIEGSDFNINAGLVYQSMSLGEALAAMAKGYNSLIEKAKVPEDVWKPEKAFPVKDAWGVITGGIDGAITEGTDKAQLVGMVLRVISNPKKTATDVAKFAKEAVSSWDNAKSLITTLGQGIVGYDASDFEEGKPAVYKGRGIGKVGGTLAVQAMAGGGLLAILQNTPDQLDNLATRIANLLNRIKAKLKALNWSDADINNFVDDLGTSEDLLTRFDNDEFDFEASKVLDQNKNLRRVAENQSFLTQVKNSLPTGITLEDIKGAIAKSDSKQSLLDELKGRLDAGDIEGFNALIKDGYSVMANLTTSTISRPSSTVIDEIARARQTARKAASDLRSEGATYQSELKAHIQTVISKSEELAESIADAHFIKGGTEKIDLSLPGAGKSGQFDRVYKNSDGTWSIVECKGGSSPLKGRQSFQQGTKEYVNSIIANLQANELKLSSSQKEYLTQLRQAITDGKVQSYVLRQKFNDDGSLGNTLLSIVTN